MYGLLVIAQIYPVDMSFFATPFVRMHVCDEFFDMHLPSN